MRLPAELTPSQLTIVVDSREQLPYSFDGFRTVQGTLYAGDYSFVGGETHTAFERKSLSDLVSCCGGERERFEHELVRLRGLPHRGVVVEASYAQIECGGWRSAIKPASVIGSILAWQMEGVPVILAGDRQTAEKYLTRMLFIIARRRWREARMLVQAIEHVEAQTVEANA